MKFYVNEKVFSLHNKFYVKNENEEDVYEISSKAISLGDKTTITDLNGNQIAYIEQELLHIMPNYNIYIDNNLVCKISKKFHLFKNDYILDNGYRVEGNAFSLNFQIFDNENNQIGAVSRKLISIGDKYEIYILDEKHIPIVLSIVVAITNDVNRAQRNNNN